MISNFNNNFLTDSVNVSKTMVVMDLNDLKQVFQAWHQEIIDANTPKEETFLTAKEVENYLNVAHSTLWRWDKDGYLKKIKVGNKVCYRLSDVERIKKGGVQA